MDGLFVLRGEVRRPPPPGGGIGGSTDTGLGLDSARRMMQDLAQEIVLDEAPDAEALASPDERRLRGALSGRRSRNDPGDEEGSSAGARAAASGSERTSEPASRFCTLTSAGSDAVGSGMDERAGVREGGSSGGSEAAVSGLSEQVGLPAATVCATSPIPPALVPLAPEAVAWTGGRPPAVHGLFARRRDFEACGDNEPLSAANALVVPAAAQVIGAQQAPPPLAAAPALALAPAPRGDTNPLSAADALFVTAAARRGAGAEQAPSPLFAASALALAPAPRGDTNPLSAADALFVPAAARRGVWAGQDSGAVQLGPAGHECTAAAVGAGALLASPASPRRGSGSRWAHAVTSEVAAAAAAAEASAAGVDDEEDDTVSLGEADAAEEDLEAGRAGQPGLAAGDGGRGPARDCCASAFRAVPPRRGLFAAVLVMLVLALVTVSLATGCVEQAPLGEFCVSAGVVQWIVAASPGVTLLCVLACWVRRTHTMRKKHKEYTWRHDGEAQRSAAGILDALAEAPEAERLKYTHQALEILRDFPDKAVIQHKGCVALEAVCRAQKGNAASVRSAGAVPVLLAALDSHLRVREVQRAGMSAVACLAKVSHQQLFNEGGIPIVLASMAKFRRDPSIQLSGALVLGAICLSSSTNRRSVAKYGGIALLLQSLERHVEKADVIIAVSEALVLLAQGGPALREQLQPSATALQGIVARFEGLLEQAKCEAAGTASVEAAATGAKRAKECEVVLKSLRRLQEQLPEEAAPEEPPRVHGDGDDGDGGEPGSDTGERAPLPAREAAVQEASSTTDEAMELQDRVRKWSAKRKSGK